ncbi:MAG: lysine biosynthesis protein LysX [Chloroflexia bacterium]|nr:lysine biosynthesis protein LysX [Chloroflexia bacterium]
MTTVVTTAGLKLGVLVSFLRQEEKLILSAARARGMEVKPIFDRELALNVSASTAAESGVDIDVLLDRSVVHSRAGYTLFAMDRWGIPTLNSSRAVTICDDKARASMVLEAAGIPSPKTFVTYSVESALEACESLGYPAVLKPVTGSWGRLIAKVNGPDQARSIIAQKSEHGSFPHEIYYVQEFIEKPGRDIRAYVIGGKMIAASYRTSEHWITNAARGAVSMPCPVTPEIEELALRACEVVGARLAGVDLIETDDGLKVIEINTGGEFKGLMTTTNRDIAGEIVEEAARLAREGATASAYAMA